MSRPKLELKNVYQNFVTPTDDQLNVLKDINLTVNEGELICMIGASGSGKTTLLRVIDHLVIPTHGSIQIDGQNVEKPGGKIGFVFQKDSLWPWRTVLANVTYGLELRKVPKKEAQEKAMYFIELVGLVGFEKYYPHQLSGGMRQRVNLARALCIEPDILLMDEPFAALDAQTREMMQLELLRIWEETHKTIVFVTHQIDEAVYLADRVIVLSSRPGSIKEITGIDLPRPRDIRIKRQEKFQNYVGYLWDLIEQDVKKEFKAKLVPN